MDVPYTNSNKEILSMNDVIISMAKSQNNPILRKSGLLALSKKSECTTKECNDVVSSAVETWFEVSKNNFTSAPTANKKGGKAVTKGAKTKKATAKKDILKLVKVAAKEGKYLTVNINKDGVLTTRKAALNLKTTNTVGFKGMTELKRLRSVNSKAFRLVISQLKDDGVINESKATKLRKLNKF